MRLLAAAFLLLLHPASHASEAGWQCWADASARYGVPVDLLYAVARVESGNRYNIVSGKNKNGSRDIGLMQINSSHLPLLKKYGITEQKLLDDPCLNLHVGAWIMAESISRHGFNWVGIGAYNAASKHKRMAYAEKVMAMYERIIKEREKVALNQRKEKLN